MESKSAFQFIAASFVAGFAQQSEHIDLISLHAGLVEGIDPQQIPAQALSSAARVAL